jgi:hypothetical protein
MRDRTTREKMRPFWIGSIRGGLTAIQLALNAVVLQAG